MEDMSDVSVPCSASVADDDLNVAADGRIDGSIHAHYPDSCTQNVLCSDILTKPKASAISNTARVKVRSG